MNELIQKQPLVEIFRKLANEEENKRTTTTWSYALNTMANVIEDRPVVEAAAMRYGWWNDGEFNYFCSQCGHGAVNGNKWPYCPNCGAKMLDF